MPEPGQLLHLSTTTEDRLGGALDDWISQLENDNRDLYRNIQVYWNRYDARPLHRVRNDPWVNASNIVLPIVPAFADACAARLWGQLHTPTRTWMIRTDNEALSDMALSTAEWINREARTTFDIQQTSYDWVFETVVVGSSVMSVTWGRKLAYRWDPKTRKVRTYQISNGPIVEHIPREGMLWERDRQIRDSSTVVRQCLYTWQDLVYYHHSANWEIEGCKGYEGIRGPGAEVLQERRRLEGVNEGRGFSDPHDVREVWIDYPMAQLLSKSAGGITAPELTDEEDEQSPLVFTYHRGGRKIMRAVAHPYYIYRWPFLDAYFRRVSGRGYSPGLAKRLEHIQAAGTTMMNQSIDAATQANGMKFFTQDPAHRNMRWNPNHPIYVQNVNDIKDIRMGPQVMPDIQLINLLMVFAERVAGISDPGFGRETRMGGHPSPATNTLVQLQEGAKLLGITLKNMRQQLSTAGEWILNLYQQHENPANPRIAAAMGAKDAALLAKALTMPGTLQFDLHALSEATNPDTERNNAIAISQLTGNYYAFILRMDSLANSPDPRVPPSTRQWAMKAIEAMTQSYRRFLEASDVDDPDQYAIQLKQAMQEGMFDAERFGQQVGAQAPGAAGPAGGGTPPAGGAPGPVQQSSLVESLLGAGGGGQGTNGGAQPGY